eukprot:TRINITY_DN5583_c0_g1_i1.p1 TRINITY_DN5583_c0_g1~~TRINITY_DN5583_c0_g1_i1.p1  ORF type:complete len:676 (+),score=175.75 TRINITY_DN5583_c0_g1_i1:28-2028(+)
MEEFQKEEHNFATSDNFSLHHLVYTPGNKNPKANLVFIHGLGDYASRHEHVFKKLVSADVSVNAFDLLGHGSSSSPKEPVTFEKHLENIASFLDQNRQDATPRFVYAVGSGAVLLLSYLLQEKDKGKTSLPDISGVILVAPTFQLPRRMSSTIMTTIKSKMTPNAQVSTNIKEKHLSRDAESAKHYHDDASVKKGMTASMAAHLHKEGERLVKKAAREFQLPFLLIHGASDRVASPAASRKFFEGAASEDKKLVLWPDLLHDVHSEPEKDEVIKTVIEWILERPKKISSTPSSPISPLKASPSESPSLSPKESDHKDEKKDDKEKKPEPKPDEIAPKKSDAPSSVPSNPSPASPESEKIEKTDTPKESPKPASSVPGRKDLRDFDVGEVLGQGAFGAVVLISEKTSKKQYAMKKISKEQIGQNESAKKTVFNERDIFNLLVHPFIVKLCYTFQDKAHLYFVLELCPNGDLGTHLKRVQRFDVTSAKFYIAETILALEYMHSKGVIHRDLKPNNILLDPNMHIKLTDFGTSKIIGTNSRARAESFCGTEEYVSPELLDVTDPFAGKSSDLWALGCVLYQILAGKTPFKGITAWQTFELIKSRQFDFPDDFDPDAKDLVSKLLVEKPEDRLGIDDFMDLKNHPFFKDLDWKDLHLQTPPPIESAETKN